MQQYSVCNPISSIPHYSACLPRYSSHLSHLPPITDDDVGQQNLGSQEPHIKRPMNPFMVWSSEKRKEIAKENPKMHNSDISKQLGAEWKNLPQETKQVFIDKSNQLREEHKKQYPGYRYRPRKKTQSVQFRSFRPESLPPSNYINGYQYLCCNLNNNYPPSVLASSMAPHYSSIQQPFDYWMPQTYLFNENVHNFTPTHTAIRFSNGEYHNFCQQQQ
ncbi:SOX domain-containing protein dichaete [Formica fusca]